MPRKSTPQSIRVQRVLELRSSGAAGPHKLGPRRKRTRTDQRRAAINDARA